LSAVLAPIVFGLVGCGSGNEADDLGIAAMCDRTEDCAQVFVDGEQVQLTCITNLKDGYCTIPDCTSDAECPEGASCVAYSDGTNYCFRECTSKDECNQNRSPDSEANCSSNFDYADPADEAENKKACIPPSS
jgi:hypothetical protein